MSNIAVKVENLGKRYKIGAKQEPYTTLRDTISGAVAGPFRRLQAALSGQPGANPSKETIWALRDLSFEVQRGQVVGVIGRNGAGKSTLLKVLSRITQPTTGYADIYGRVGSLLEVGTGFHPELTGRENIFLNGAILGMKREEIKRKFDEIVSFAEVEKFLDTPVKHYSSGMYVRLAFAVAAHLEPEILLVDEVLAVGDAAFQKKCLGKMGDIAHGGRTILFVSHNMAAVSQLCHYGIWIDQGQVRMIDEASTVVRSYLSAHGAQVAERQWTYPGDAPGDERVRLLAGRVVQNGQVADVVDINAPCSLEMDFLVLREENNLVAAANFYNAEGLCLFCSADWRPNSLSPGKYRKSLDIPAQVFAEGQTSILLQLVFYDPDVRSVVLPDALIFEAVDSDHPRSVRGLYKGSWPGVMRLGLPWSDAAHIAPTPQ